jgi:hypothetical protein
MGNDAERRSEELKSLRRRVAEDWLDGQGQDAQDALGGKEGRSAAAPLLFSCLGIGTEPSVVRP